MATAANTQPAATTSHFALLGVPQTFDIDVDELRRKYFQLSRRTHPDRQVSVDAGALRESAHGNRAFEVLSHPVLRAEHLLELAGGPSAADDKTVPQDVLTQTLVLREEIDEAKSAGDEATLAALRSNVHASHDQLLDEIGAFAARRLPGDDRVQRELRLKLNSIKYYQRMLEQL